MYFYLRVFSALLGLITCNCGIYYIMVSMRTYLAQVFRSNIYMHMYYILYVIQYICICTCTCTYMYMWYVYIPCTTYYVYVMYVLYVCMSCMCIYVCYVCTMMCTTCVYMYSDIRTCTFFFPNIFYLEYSLCLDE
jgi:hypothetical protein